MDNETIGMFETSLAEEAWDFELTESEVSEIFADPCYRSVIRSKAFQRLKDIHFLGSIDYTIDPDGPKPNKRHTRYQHSLGVARLALAYAKNLDLDKRRERIVVVSALLHDIGHAPLSHSLESVFKEAYGIDHHRTGEKIITGAVPLGDGLFRAIHKWDINPFDILSNIAGVGKSPYRELFSHSINIDTIEAILRGYTYIHNTDRIFSPFQVLHALIKRDSESQKILDSFWSLKQQVYSQLINNAWGVVADYLCQRYMKENLHHFKESYYFGTESELRADHLPLFSWLENLGSSSLHSIFPEVDEIPCRRRTFYVDNNVTLTNYASIDKRYAQIKEPAVCVLTKKGVNLGHGIGRHQNSLFVLE